jgi:hypothetical protein
MCDSTNVISWLALAVSIGSLSFAGFGSWLNREKLRLDLYNRRFDIYSRTLDLLHALEVWNPTALEKNAHSLQDSPDLDKSLKAFTKASRESQFLFADDSEIHENLDLLHSAAIALIGFKRDSGPNLNGADLVGAFANSQQRSKTLLEIPAKLEKAMKKYLDFHGLNLWF